jgi:hypothetical protein
MSPKMVILGGPAIAGGDRFNGLAVRAERHARKVAACADEGP